MRNLLKLLSLPRNDSMMLLKHFIFVTCIHSVLIIIKSSVAWRPFQIEFTNVSARSFVNSYEVNSSISATGAISFYVNILQDIATVYAKTEIIVESSRGKYDLELVNKTINVCKFFGDRKYEPITQVFYKMFTKTSNFPKSCPIRKKLYFFKDLTMNPEDLPPVFPNQKLYFDVTLMTKYGNKVERLFKFIAYVQTHRLNV